MDTLVDVGVLAPEQYRVVRSLAKAYARRDRFRSLLTIDDYEQVGRLAVLDQAERWERPLTPLESHIRAGWAMAVLENRYAKRWHRDRELAKRGPRPDLPRVFTVPPKHAREMDVADALATLSPKEREVVHMRFWLGCDWNESAEVLGITRHAVARRMSSARDKLIAFLGPSYADSFRPTSRPRNWRCYGTYRNSPSRLNPRPRRKGASAECPSSSPSA